ncbi:PH domain-containing protein [Leifsonia sp. AG29]|uniref:PH domain-containing protein n=1 Tax=Leifsonia sp. AG29 TaxID=2598860 RepID=UPI00131D4BFF|nr:PH domain-containing protein [Leifsonia sp. AG29]
MSNTTEGIPPGPPEKVVARLRSHARFLFWPSLALIAASGAFGYFVGRLDEVWQVVLLWSSAAVVLLVLFLLPLASWLSRRYTITTRRIVLRHGFFVRVRQELLHSRGYDVSVRRTWLQSAFRSGDVLINSGLEHPVVLRDVPRADQVRRALSELMEHSQNVVGVRRQQSESVSDETTVWGAR